MKLIFSKFASQDILQIHYFSKEERLGTTRNKLEQARRSQKQLQTNGTRQSIRLCGQEITLILDSH